MPPHEPHDVVPAPAFLEGLRDDVVRRLGIHFASGDLSRAEVGRRVALALSATSPDTLDLLVVDLPPPERDADVQARATALIAAEPVPERGVLAAVMGGNGRKGAWLVPRHLKVVAFMGGADLDLRAARFAPGVTEIEVVAVMGGVEIVVPHGVRVETVAVAAMGGVETNVRDVEPRDPDAPVLRVSGFATFGGVNVTTRQPNTKKLTRFAALLEKARAKARRRGG
jgi:hypothetical protein